MDLSNNSNRRISKNFKGAINSDMNRSFVHDFINLFCVFVIKVSFFDQISFDSILKHK